MSKHTPEPWLYQDYGQNARIHPHVLGPNKEAVASCRGDIPSANGRRIVKCVNFCAGVQLPEGVTLADVLNLFGKYFQEYDNPVPDHLLRARYRDDLRALLAKFPESGQ